MWKLCNRSTQKAFASHVNVLAYGFHELREVGFELFLELGQLYGLSII